MKEPDVISEISSKDEMYRGNKKHYFRVGRSAIKSIKIAMRMINKNESNIKNILDLPSGYGRVLRNLRSAFPNSEITSCDIDKDAVDFCQKIFNTIPIYSEENLEKIIFKNKFDLIWCGSLLTHLDKKKWESFLNLFFSVLNSNGLLVFTVHGRHAAHRMRSKVNNYGLDDSEISTLLNEYETKDFGYVNYRNQENYGISLSSPSFVLSLLEKKSNVSILFYNEKGWYNHQDIIACIRESDNFFSDDKK